MVSELILEKIGECIKNADTVQLKVLNGERLFFYKGFFIKIDYDNMMASFYDVLKDKMIISLKDIEEIVTLVKGGAKQSPAWREDGT